MEKSERLRREEAVHIRGRAYGYFRVYDLGAPRSWTVTDDGTPAARRTEDLPVITMEERRHCLAMRDEAFREGRLGGSFGHPWCALQQDTAEWYPRNPEAVISIPDGPVIEKMGEPIEIW